MDLKLNIVIANTLKQVDEIAWNTLVSENQPFLQYQFLYGLELHGCADANQGWHAHHFLVYDDKQRLLAALPCYKKQHSYGEYIFDWAWADAYQRAGMPYYPKLSCAIPFTPATGTRLLIHPRLNKQQTSLISNRLIQTLLKSATNESFSSIHVLFNRKDLIANFEKHGFFSRKSTQFHWKNATNKDEEHRLYDDFDEFLTCLSSRKRKNIKRERRRVIDANVTFRWYTKERLSTDIMATMFAFYRRTINRYGAQQYLNIKFFEHLGEQLSHHTAVLLAYYNDEPIAGGLFFYNDTTLYGRYWGALDDFHSLHFETCYYQAIEYCIKHGLSNFEAGAQGEHKLSRGLLPKTTYSLHWFVDQRFNTAVQNYVNEEQMQTDQYQSLLNQHSPFKQPTLKEI